jgi:protein involved in polysaccharide export with SLBB domain
LDYVITFFSWTKSQEREMGIDKFFLILGMVFALSCQQALPAENAVLKPDLKGHIDNSIVRKYFLGPNDVIKIVIPDLPELNSSNQVTLKVQPDGKIDFPLIGVLEVSGMTLDELNSKLNAKYAFYLKNPKVSVNLTETRPFIAYVKGAVVNPGSYEITTDTDKSTYLNNIKPEILIVRNTPLLSNILVAAGGVSFDADIENIKVENTYDGSSYEVNLFEMLDDKSDTSDNKNDSHDLYLMSGDIITVPRLPTPFAVNAEKYKKFAGATFSPKTIPVKVLGYVNKPGLIQLDSALSNNLNSAISQAGGYLLDSAYAPEKVILCRADQNGKLVAKEVNPMSNDITLMPNDIIYIPEKTRPLVGKAFDYLLRIANPINAFANTYNNGALMFDPHRYQVIGK